jgi:cation:H+ antiporter
MPEMVVSSKAALDGYGGIAIGNVVGSNIFNIAAILGISALIQPLRVHLHVIRLDMPVMLLASSAFLFFFQNNIIGRLEGGILLAGMIVYTGGMVISTAVYPVKAFPDGRFGRSAE